MKKDYYKKLGEHLAELIDEKYSSRRKFGEEYLKQRDREYSVSEEEKNQMSHVLSEIIKGNRGIQIEQIPYFAKLLGISYEQLLDPDFGKFERDDRVTNYSIALSNDQEKWEEYINREDKLILNDDEFGNTVLDYAISKGNYKLIKYLIDRRYISFNFEDQVNGSLLSVSIERREIKQLESYDKIVHGRQLKENLKEFATKNKDTKLLKKLSACDSED